MREDTDENSLTSKGYCDIRECKNWSGVILIMISPKFNLNDFPPIIDFVWNTFGDCQQFGGTVYLLPVNYLNNLEKSWSSNKNELVNKFDTIFNKTQFIVPSFPSPSFMEKTIGDAINTFKTSPVYDQSVTEYGRYLLLITNYEVYLDQFTATNIRNNAKANQVRVKILLIDDYNDDFDSAESDEDFFEMIAERGEKTEVDDIKGLSTSKMPSKMYACHNYEPFPKPYIKITKSNKKGIIIGVVLGASGMILILGILIFIFIKYRQRVRRDQINTLSWVNNHTQEINDNEYGEHINDNKTKDILLNDMLPFSIGTPTNNDTSDLQVEGDNNIIDEDNKILERVLNINYNEKLGSGAFSCVFKGTLLLESDYVRQKLASKNNKNRMEIIVKNCKKNLDDEMNDVISVDVAIKTELNSDNIFQSAESKEFLIKVFFYILYYFLKYIYFLKEINTLKQISYHPHVLSYFGSCFKDSSLCIILEYCSNGNLLSWLHDPKNKKNIDLKILLSFTWQIADGMYYLAVKNLIHRDLAARNILLDNDLVAKISDFGLSRVFDHNDVEVQNEYMLRTNAKIPVKHTAIEALRDGVYTEKSDVWAYAVLLFEIFSLGAPPYESLSLVEILPFLSEGSRLPRPLLVTDEVWNIMEDCWKEDPKERPNFGQIRERLTGLLEENSLQYGYLELSGINENPENNEVQI
uniref:receptor protein-tyrosine kinase n=1 Tax=Parastrongyloides trichosuri TaxID=131310 RepID=A0A0N4Z5X8_PARTI